MQKVLVNAYRNTMAVLMLVITCGLAVGSFFQTADMALNGVDEKTVFQNTIWPVTAVFVVVLIYTLRRNMERVRDADTKKLVMSLLACDFVLCMLWVVLSNTREGADQAQVLYAAKQFAAGDYGKLAYDKYMGLFPYQLPLALLYEPFYILFGDVTPFLWQFINALLICGIQYFLYVAVRECSGEKMIVNLCLLLQFLDLPLILYASFVYGTLIGLFFALASVCLMFKYAGDYRWRHLVLSALCIMLSCLFRTNNLIVLIAGAIVAALFALSGRKRLLFFIPLSLTLVCGGRWGVYKSYELRSGMDIPAGIPFTMNIAMGLADNAERAPGWYNGYTWDSYYELGCDSAAADSFARARINESLRKFADSPLYAVDFFTKKIKSTWLNPDFQGLWNSEHHGQYIACAPVIYNLFTGELHSLSRFFLGNIQFLIYFGAFVSMLCRLRQKEAGWKYFTCALIFAGGFLFHIFWETKAQYAIVYYVMLFPYAADGLARLSCDGVKKTGRSKTKSRIYVCHTFYHVYVAILKEMKLARETDGGGYKKADIALSSISTDFGNLGDRLSGTGIFDTVIALDEKREDFFPELAKYRKDYGNVLRHMINRMIFTKKLAKCEIPYMQVVDFEAYGDIYVFCDSDPVGYYLNYKHIYYHAMEDGLDCLKNLDDAYVANHGHFKLKTWFSLHNLIFIMNGWGKYCIDMEINDRSVVPTDCPRFVEVPRKPLERELTSEQKKLVIQAFIDDADKLIEQMKPSHGGEEFACFLTEPHPVDVEARKRVCIDVIEKYCKGYRVLIKPHPRDMIDYAELCPDAVVLRGRFPVEVLNFFEGLHIKRAVSIVTTAMNNMDFVDEKINLGVSFWDAYENPEKHAYNKKAGLSLADK